MDAFLRADNRILPMPRCDSIFVGCFNSVTDTHNRIPRMDQLVCYQKSILDFHVNKFVTWWKPWSQRILEYYDFEHSPRDKFNNSIIYEIDLYYPDGGQNEFPSLDENSSYDTEWLLNEVFPLLNEEAVCSSSQDTGESHIPDQPQNYDYAPGLLLLFPQLANAPSNLSSPSQDLTTFQSAFTPVSYSILSFDANSEGVMYDADLESDENNSFEGSDGSWMDGSITSIRSIDDDIVWYDAASSDSEDLYRSITSSV